MSFLILLLCAGAAFGATVKISVNGTEKLFYDIEDAEMLFEQFILDFGKQYDSREEKLKRFEVFKEKIHAINELNMKHDTIYGINMFTDLTDEEFSKQYNSGLMPLEGAMLCQAATVNLASAQFGSSFDWREKKVVTPVKNQGTCGSCWAFSIIGNLEAQYVKEKGQVLDLSEQQLLDCEPTNSGCEVGGLPVPGGKYVVENGVMLEYDYPYMDRRGACAYNPWKVVARASNCLDFGTASEEELKAILTQHGPVSIGVDSLAFHTYTGGILRSCVFKKCGHAVLLVGYNDGPDPYWIIKNSWGQNWGEQGYIRIPMGSMACGISMCPQTTVLQV